MRIAKTLPYLAITALLIVLILYPDSAIDNAKNALSAWWETVLPSLLPFLMLSSILIGSGFAKKIGAVFAPAASRIFSLPGEGGLAVILGWLCGYPGGAKIIAQLMDSGALDERQAKCALAAASCPGPMFMLGTVAAGFLSSANLGPYIMASCYISAVLCGMAANLFLKPSPRRGNSFSVDQSPAPGADAAASSMAAMLTVCGYMALFSVVSGAFEQTGVYTLLASVFAPEAGSVITPVVTGAMEVASGCMKLGAGDLPLAAKGIIAAGLSGGGGLSVILQQKAMLKSRIGIGYMAAVKTLHAALSAGTCAAALKLFPPVLQTASLPSHGPHGTLAYSAAAFALCAAAAALLLLARNARGKRH